MDNKEKIISLREQGLSYGSIAKMVGLSRARIHQICTGYSSPSSNIPYKKIKDCILYRDYFKCQWNEACKGEKTTLENLVIHHIDFNDKNNSFDNLITFCT